MNILNKTLTRLSQRVLSRVLLQVIEEIDILEQQSETLNRTVALVMNGTWVGQGADAFVEDLSSRKKQLDDVIVTTQSLYQGITQAHKALIAVDHENTQTIQIWQKQIESV
ncbi:MAG: WXG100 family type VII secretion target [Anaerolineales bacterium]|nr:WXG100 family type VII secretion target [Anaerolineales bacterium]